MNRSLNKLLFSLITAAILTACSSQASHDTAFIADRAGPAAADNENAVLRHRLILLGDAGYSTLDPWQPSLKQAAERASLAPEQTTVLMLGDNIYYRGFPRVDSNQETYSEKQQTLIDRLDAQLKIARVSGAQLYVLPGNHDWYAEQVDDQARYIADYAREHQAAAHFEPYEKGKPPLPEVVHFDGISTIFIDSMWLLEASDHEVEIAMTELDGLIRDTLQAHPANLILLSAHHPIETMGPHNKYYTSRGYRLAVGLIGLFTKIGKQDLPHPSYRRMVDAIRDTVERHEARIVYAAGHDHSLQVFGAADQHPPQYRIVSGAANTRMVTGVGDNRNTLFAVAKEGFVELEIFDTGVRLSAYTIDRKTPVFSRWLWENTP